MANGFLSETESQDTKRYRRSLWWVNNRAKLQKLGIGLFIVVDACLIIFAIWTFVDTYLISYSDEQRAVAEMAVYGQEELRDYARATAALDLQHGKVSVMSIGENRFDFYVNLKNPNDEWYADFTYNFVFADATATEPRTSFILPFEEKPVVELAFESDNIPRNAELNISDVDWHRIDAHKIFDYPAWLRERFDVVVSDVIFTSDIQFDTQKLGRVTFSVANNTAYSYKTPNFYVLLYQGDTVSGVTKTQIDELKSGETRDVLINWFGLLPSVGRVEVIPEVNIFDLDSYIPLEGESQADVRTRVLSQ